MVLDDLGGEIVNCWTQKVIGESSESKGISGVQSSVTFVNPVHELFKNSPIDAGNGVLLLVVELEEGLEEVALFGEEAPEHKRLVRIKQE